MEIKDRKNLSLGFQREYTAQAQKEDERRLKAIDSTIGKILDQIHYITKLQDEQKNVAPVENIKIKIERAANEITKLTTQPENTAEADLTQQQTGPSGDDIPIDKHPLLDMDGMPMEIKNLDPEFLEALGVTKPLDKTELENQINKAKEKYKQALNLKAKLKQIARHQPKARPTLKQANELVVKYKQVAKMEMKLQQKLEIEAPAPTPRWTPPPPRPPGA